MSVAVPPGTAIAGDGVTTTDATRSTVTTKLALSPAAVAVIVEVPGAASSTTAAGQQMPGTESTTVATTLLLLVHVMGGSG